MILCILTSCLDHYTTSVLVKMVIVALYIYIVFTCRAQLTSVLSGRAQPRPAVEQSAWRRRCGGTQGTVPVAVGPSRPRPGNTDKLTRRVGSTKVPLFRVTRARARTSHKIRFEAIAKHNKTICVGLHLN